VSVEEQNPWQRLTEDEIQKLVESLDSLQEGELGVTMLVACGQRAVGPLRRFLLEGKPASVAEPRRRAVRTLAELGAQDALLEYLRMPVNIPDPVLRFSEETVISLAAKLLAQAPTEEICRTLLELAKERMLPGVAESLGACRLTQGIPYLIRALGDDCCRTAAEDALSTMTAEARDWLIVAALHPEPSQDEETPSSLCRRRRSLRLLLEGRIGQREWMSLRSLLKEGDAEIAATTARLGMEVAGEQEKSALIAVLLSCVDKSDWFLRSEISEALLAHYDLAEPLIRQAIAQRELKAGRGFDPGLALLYAALRRAER